MPGAAVIEQLLAVPSSHFPAGPGPDFPVVGRPLGDAPQVPLQGKLWPVCMSTPTMRDANDTLLWQGMRRKIQNLRKESEGQAH